MTDRPEFYKTIQNRVNVIAVTEDTFAGWKGPFNYFWRIKVKAIEQLCSLHPDEPVLYLDSDTFLYNDFERVYPAITEGRALMHERESALATLPTKTARRMYAALKGVGHGSITDLAAFDMWNAGVVITPNTRGQEEWRLAVGLIDEMCSRKVPVYFIEQYCVGIALQTTYGLAPAGACIAHYWSNKDEWNTLISQFFHRLYLKGLDFDHAVSMFSELPLLSIPEKRIVKNTNPRLKKLIDKLFKDKKVSYLERTKSIQ